MQSRVCLVCLGRGTMNCSAQSSTDNVAALLGARRGLAHDECGDERRTWIGQDANQMDIQYPLLFLLTCSSVRLGRQRRTSYRGSNKQIDRLPRLMCASSSSERRIKGWEQTQPPPPPHNNNISQQKYGRYHVPPATGHACQPCDLRQKLDFTLHHTPSWLQIRYRGFCDVPLCAYRVCASFYQRPPSAS